MASYRPFPPPLQSSYVARPPPSQNPSVPPAMAQVQSNQYSQNWGSYQQQQQQQQQQFNLPPPPRSQLPQPAQQQQYQFPPPPPPPLDNSYPPPPPPPQHAQMYYPPEQYSSQYVQRQPLQPPQPQQPPPPPPPPSSPPPSSVAPPPPPPPPASPPPSSLPPPTQNKHIKPAEDRGAVKGARNPGWNDTQQAKHHKAPVPPVPAKRSNGPPPGRMETEEERRLRKRREYEKQKQEEKHRQHIKESQSRVLQKTQVSSGNKGHGSGSVSGSLMTDKRTAPLLGGERIENRLKKPTTFLCKLKFRNDLPDPTAQPKLMSLRRDKDLFTKYTLTSLEKLCKPQLYVESDLGIPLDLLDLSAYNPPRGRSMHLEPEDEELIRDDDPVTPIKKDGIKRKERPTDAGLSWLVKTQYISPISMESTNKSMEKHAKEMRETEGRNILENLSSREGQIREIAKSFEACRARPVHATNHKLQPVEILPLLPDFDRFEDQFVVATFDSAPTIDSEIFGKLEKDVRDAHEAQAVMKSFVADSANPDKFLAYMVPSPNELSKDIYDENEDVSYSWIREYHWDVRGDDAEDPSTYLVAFSESKAHYMPLPTKLVLRKKRAREGKSTEEVEHFPVPSRLTVRRRPVAKAIEHKDDGGGYSASKSNVYDSKRRRLEMEDGIGDGHKNDDDDDLEGDQSSGGEYDDMSD